jgi:hypothetical protein
MDQNESRVDHWKRNVRPEEHLLAEIVVSVIPKIDKFMFCEEPGPEVRDSARKLQETLNIEIARHGYDFSKWDMPALVGLKTYTDSLHGIVDILSLCLRARGVAEIADTVTDTVSSAVIEEALRGKTSH